MTENLEQKKKDRKLSRSGISLYKRLNLEKTATQQDIKAAYRRLALKYHPDRNQGSLESTEIFKEINIAHKILTDEKKKEIYDKYGSMGLYIADKIGEKYVDMYFTINSCWFRSLLCCCFVITGCGCCCFCCFFCCSGCCGKCKLDVDDVIDPDDGPVTEQPRRSEEGDIEEATQDIPRDHMEQVPRDVIALPHNV